jgi:hypothetical protein
MVLLFLALFKFKLNFDTFKISNQSGTYKGSISNGCFWLKPEKFCFSIARPLMAGQLNKETNGL